MKKRRNISPLCSTVICLGLNIKIAECQTSLLEFGVSTISISITNIPDWSDFYESYSESQHIPPIPNITCQYCGLISGPTISDWLGAGWPLNKISSLTLNVSTYLKCRFLNLNCVSMIPVVFTRVRSTSCNICKVQLGKEGIQVSRMNIDNRVFCIINMPTCCVGL